MKIGNPTDKPPAPLPVSGQPAAAVDASKAGAANAAAVAATLAPAPAASAHVELSSTASSLLAGGSGADFDTDKVSRISDAIAGGTFKIDPAVIADKLIANAQELLGKVAN